MGNSTYFAADESQKTAATVLEKVDAWCNSWTSSGFIEKLRSLYCCYHGAYYTDAGNGHQITFSGEQGELVNLPVNHFRNIAQHILNMTCSNRPVMECRSTNTDYKSQIQTVLANSILEYYMREKKLEEYIRQAVEHAIVYGTGFIRMEWDATKGDVVDYIEETQTEIKEGDLVFNVLSVFDVVYDGTKESANDTEWVAIRTWKNKYDLAAKYPEYANKIIEIETKDDINNFKVGISNILDRTEDIQVVEFYHERSDAVPNGRYLMFVAEDIILQDIPMPYRKLPVFRISAGDIHGSPYGYTPMMDLVPLQEAINSLYSTILTNQNAFGVQNILLADGSDISSNQLVGSLNVIKWSGQPGMEPKALQLTATPKEVFDYLDKLVHDMETISGVNSVARGNPEASLKSGTALALVQSMALQFMSGLQQNYVNLVEHIGTAIIKILQDFANTPRLVAIAGKTNRTYMKEFTGEDISSISRVTVDIGNPMATCLKKDTPILMYNGSIKMVQDIKTGDILMGPDSKPRTVESTAIGQEMMYDIHYKSEKNEFIYGCNESHILTLKYCSDDNRYNCKKGDQIDISVREYLTLTDREKNLLQGFRTKIDFEQKNLLIDPYILGLWLGDGHSACTSLTSMDEELVNEWTNYATKLNLKVKKYIQKNNKSSIYRITSGSKGGSPDRNIFHKNLKDLNLINNKHIPQIYLTSSREDRLKLLAGILDTDGSLSTETFIFTQVNNQLTENVIYLARSLGFKVTKSKINSKFRKFSNNRQYICSESNKLFISGNVWEIPTKLERKQVKQKDKFRDWLNYGIDVKPVGIGTYYGFILKEEPHFVLGDFTVTHNTTAGRVQMATELIQYGEITPKQYVTLIHTGNLEQFTESTVHETLLMRAENEVLMDGQEPLVTPIDNHKEHIDHHKSILFDPDLRNDPQLVKRVLDHIQKHIDALREVDPDLLMLLGQQPLPPQPGPNGPPGGPGQPPGPPQGNAPGGPPPNGPGPDAQMMPPEQGQMGPGVQGGKVTGPGLPPNGQRISGLPQVKAGLLPNAALQQQSLQNVKMK